MATTRGRRKQEPKTQQKPDRTPIIIALIAAIPTTIGAIVQLINAGHVAGWW